MVRIVTLVRVLKKRIVAKTKRWPHWQLKENIVCGHHRKLS